MILANSNINIQSHANTLRQLMYILLIVAAGCLFYKYLESQALKHSAALFIGIPVFMSISLASISNIKHITLTVMSGLAAGLIASFLYLKEGSFCVPMTAPLFLISGLIISFSFTKLRQSNFTNLTYLFPVFALVFLSLEGINNFTSIARIQTVSATKDVSLSAHEIKLALSKNTQLSDIPVLLSYGFPQPNKVTGSGIDIGDRRSIYFSGGEGLPGTAEFEITKLASNSIEYSLIDDSSHISHWLTWKKSTVSWQEISPGKTRVSWSINYERKLDPFWYFGPIEKFAVDLAAQTLLNNFISPKS